MTQHKNGVTDEMIIDTYQRLGSGPETAKALGFAVTTIYGVLRRCGVARNRTGRLFDDVVEGEIVAKYEGGISACKLASQYGCSSDPISSVLRRNGIKIRSPKASMSEDEKQHIKTMYKSGMQLREVADKGGRHYNTVRLFLVENHPELLRHTGPGGPRWKGGRTASHGYSAVWISPDDPLAAMAQKSGYVSEHRLIMARDLGRVLLPSETVHHINGDKADNRIANLELRQGKHGKHVVMCCLDCGSQNIGPVGIGKNGG